MLNLIREWIQIREARRKTLSTPELFDLVEMRKILIEIQMGGSYGC